MARRREGRFFSRWSARPSGWRRGESVVATARVFPPSIAALLALGLVILVTGALHEDGLADMFDAFRAGRSPEKIQAILKDSRIGVYGAVALTMTLLLRWQAIEFRNAGADSRPRGRRGRLSRRDGRVRVCVHADR